MSLGSSASFTRSGPSRDTSTTESESPSFRDAKPHGQPLFPSPYPPPRFVVGSFGFVGWNWILRHSEKGELFSNWAFSFARGNSVICYQFQLITPNSQLPTLNRSLSLSKGSNRLSKRTTPNHFPINRLEGSSQKRKARKNPNLSFAQRENGKITWLFWRRSFSEPLFSLRAFSPRRLSLLPA